MLINPLKSLFVFHNLEPILVRLLVQPFGFVASNLDKRLKYLGVFLMMNKYSKEHRFWLLARVENRLKTWYLLWLSQAGRLMLIKLVLEAIPFYWTSLAWIDKVILEKIR